MTAIISKVATRAKPPEEVLGVKGLRGEGVEGVKRCESGKVRRIREPEGERKLGSEWWEPGDGKTEDG